MIKTIDYTTEAFQNRANEFDVTTPEAAELFADMKETIESLETKPFLCANEIDNPNRVFCVKFADDIKYFCNPIYQAKGNPKLVRELDAVTGKEYILPRLDEVTICYQDELGEAKASKFTDTGALIVCQAMDMLDGLRDTDFGLEVLPEFDKATDEERQEVMEAYVQYLKNLAEQLDMELRADEELKDEWNSYRFMKAKANGEIETMPIENEPKLNRKQRRTLAKLKKRLTKVKVDD